MECVLQGALYATETLLGRERKGQLHNGAGTVIA